ncbi:uncharacterized protein LOC116015894 [Ipomoea triloba]|uniref:uncharacterized protein LOC116015894 n=1 Tax=Ipomoea triloba TaxID=35885 RepID=UPI00125E6C3A|nr:uncharacterized protein LOC116015894 [Ipomoea triloba]
MYPMFILGSDISPFNVRSAMKVRVFRAYNVPERRGSNAIRSKEVVFHDKEGTLVHAHIPKQLVPKFINDFKEGSVWAVKNFLVITNFYTYRTTPHKYMIKFNYQTTVKQFKKIDFPSQMFRLTPFQALKVEGVDDKLLVGKILGNQIRCTLWDDHVGKIEPFFNASSHDPVVVILQFCRIRTDVTNGEVRLCSSYDVTQVFINQQSQEFLEFRESLSLRGVQTPMRSIASFPSLNYERMMEQTESLAQYMKTIDEIYQTREELAPGCNKKLESKGRIYYCGKCESNCEEGKLRYKLKIRVADLEGNAPFLLWDRECNQLLGIFAAELKSRRPNRLIQVHAPALLGIHDKDFSSKVEHQMVDDDDHEEFDESDEEESSLGFGVAGNQDAVGDRDEFSTTQTSKNKGILNVKLEGGK